MRLLVKSETDAFWLVVALSLVLGAALAIGYLVTPLAGIGAFLAGTWVGIIVALSHEPRATPLAEAEQAGHRSGARGHEGRLVLLIVNTMPVGDQLWHALAAPGAPQPALEVLAPVLLSRTHFVTTDIDRETSEARERLRKTLVCAAEHGLAASGEIGDPIDPLAALADELRSHNIDEILVMEHPPGQTNWVEATIVDALHNQTQTPITEFVSS
jgi:hypothetical protein